MAKFKEKIEARKLRKDGLSIWEIAQKLKISKSTVSYWCRDIQLTEIQIQKLFKKQLSASYIGRIKALEKKRAIRLASIETLKQEGISEIGKLKKREFFLAGLGVYWGEGYKSLTTAAVVSSNPKIILFMIKWFRETCGVSPKDFILRVGLNEAFSDRIKKIERHWSIITGISNRQFTKTTLIKTKIKKVYSNPDEYFGTLRISIRRSSRLQRKILGWLEGLAE
jgi:predicted transcriptional regulator